MMMKLKISFIVIVQLSTLTEFLCIPCGYKHTYDRNFDAWQCPFDAGCIQKQDVCAPPPFNTPRCPNGGDIGYVSCTQELCAEIGFYKCPFDPFCVQSQSIACTRCPHGAKNSEECTYYDTSSRYASCGSSNTKYYSKAYEACDNKSDCPLDQNGASLDEEGCNDDDSCNIKTTGQRPIKCLKDNVCVNDDRRSKCTNCPSGWNTIC